MSERGNCFASWPLKELALDASSKFATVQDTL